MCPGLRVESVGFVGIRTMSHHHTYYVTSSYILCHIIIPTMSHQSVGFVGHVYEVLRASA